MQCLKSLLQHWPIFSSGKTTSLYLSPSFFQPDLNHFTSCDSVTKTKRTSLERQCHHCSAAGSEDEEETWSCLAENVPITPQTCHLLVHMGEVPTQRKSFRLRRENTLLSSTFDCASKSSSSCFCRELWVVIRCLTWAQVSNSGARMSEHRLH